jgi:hypothetical protein
VVEFAATVSQPRRFIEPSGPAVVRAQLDAWLASPSLRVLFEAPAALIRWLELVDAG